MEVTSQFEGINHALAVGHVRQDAQLELPVVGHHQAVTWLGHKRFPDSVDVFVAGWLVLQVGAPARDASSLGVQVHAAVDAT